MKCRLRSLSLSLAALILGSAQANADILAVEQGPVPDVLRFNTAGTQFTFATANLDTPIGIGADSSGNVYVVNQGASANSAFHDSVAKFSPTGTPLGFFVTAATPPGNTLNAPVDIAFDNAGKAYVTSGGDGGAITGNLAIYTTATGAYVGAAGTTFTNTPTGIGFNPFNNLLYIVNGPGSPNPNSFVIVNPANLTTPTPMPTIITPTGSGVLDGGQQVAFDQLGHVFIASFGSSVGGIPSRIQEYAASGAYIGPVATVNGGAEGVAYDPTTNTLYASFLGLGPGGLPTPTSGFIEKYTFNGVSFIDSGPLATGLNFPGYLLFVPPVPEPGSVVLMGLGLVAMAGYRVSRRNRAA